MNSAADSSLDFHDDILGLCDSMKRVATMVLSALAAGELHQPFLDKLAGIVQEHPTRYPISHLCRLIRKFDEGGLLLLIRSEGGS